MQKTNFKTRLLALLTAVFMVIVSMPFAAFAAGEGGTDVIPNEINVYFNAYDGTVGLNLQADDADESSAGVAKYVLNSASVYKALPTVTNVPEDKEFDGWYIAGTNVKIVETTFTFDVLKDYAVKDDAQNDNVTIEARFKDKVVEPETTPIEVSFHDGFGHLIKTETLKETTDSVEEPAATRVEYDTDKYEFHGDWANTFTDPVETNMVRSFDYNTLKFFATTDDKGVAHVYLYPVLTVKKPETKTVKFCFDIEDGEKGIFTGKEAGYTSVMREYTVNGDTTKLAIPDVKPTDKYDFKGWASEHNEYVIDGASSEIDLFGRNFDDVADGTVIMLYAQFEKKATEPEEPETPELKTINVSFVDAKTGRAVADTISFVKGEDGKHFPMEATNVGKDQILQGWNGHAIDAFYGAGQWVTFDDLAKYVAASSINKDGYASLTFEADVATKQPSKPVAADVTKIYVHFNDENGLYKTDIVYNDHGYITAPATDMSVSEYDYTWNNDEGLIFNVGDVIKFDDVKSHAGSFAREDEKTVSAHISFTKTAKKEAPAEAVVRNVIFQLSQVEGAKWATEDEQKAYGKNDRKYQTWSTDSGKYVAPAAAKDGKDFDYWVCNYGNEKIVIRAGEEFNFDTLTTKGISKSEAGDFAFNPVFKDKASSSSSSASSSSSSSSASSSSNTTTTSASQKQVVKAAAAPANTTKVLPKTGATNAAPLIGGSLAVVALLMGYGVYGLVLRKKD